MMTLDEYIAWMNHLQEKSIKENGYQLAEISNLLRVAKEMKESNDLSWQPKWMKYFENRYEFYNEV